MFLDILAKHLAVFVLSIIYNQIIFQMCANKWKITFAHRTKVDLVFDEVVHTTSVIFTLYFYRHIYLLLITVEITKLG